MMYSNLSLRTTNWIAALLITSALCWWVGALALFPVIGSVYTASDSYTQIREVTEHRTAWSVQNLLFLLGMLAASVGLVCLAKGLKGMRGRHFARLGLVSIVVATVAGLGMFYSLLRFPENQTLDAPPMFSGAGSHPLHATYGVLTLVAFICYGVTFFQCGQRGVAVVSILLSSAMLVAVINRRDNFPPLFFYLVPFLFGVRLLFGRRLTKEPGEKNPFNVTGAV